jgi:hypothetical protein
VAHERAADLAERRADPQRASVHRRAARRARAAARGARHSAAAGFGRPASG